jgi:BRCT domain type II-containing protein
MSVKSIFTCILIFGVSIVNALNLDNYLGPEKPSQTKPADAHSKANTKSSQKPATKSKQEPTYHEEVSKPINEPATPTQKNQPKNDQTTKSTPTQPKSQPDDTKAQLQEFWNKMFTRN